MSFTPICRNMPVRAERKSVKSSTMRKRLVLYSTISDLHAGDRDIHVLGLVINQSRPWRLVSDTSANRCGMIVTGQCRPERMRRLFHCAQGLLDRFNMTGEFSCPGPPRRTVVSTIPAACGCTTWTGV